MSFPELMLSCTLRMLAIWTACESWERKPLSNLIGFRVPLVLSHFDMMAFEEVGKVLSN